jgi:hypothetical protein
VQSERKIGGKRVSSIEEKLDVISRLEKGERIVDKWRNVRLAHSSVRTIGDNADRVTAAEVFV